VERFNCFVDALDFFFFFVKSLVVSNSAAADVERLVSDIISFVSSWTLNSAHLLSLRLAKNIVKMVVYSG